MPTLTATYTSPSPPPTSKTFAYPLPSLPSFSPSSSNQTTSTTTATTVTTADRTAYLLALQSSIKDLQASTNAFLTRKMGEEKAAAAGDKDVGLEENYGEEEGEGEEGG